MGSVRIHSSSRYSVGFGGNSHVQRVQSKATFRTNMEVSQLFCWALICIQFQQNNLMEIITFFLPGNYWLFTWSPEGKLAYFIISLTVVGNTTQVYLFLGKCKGLPFLFCFFAQLFVTRISFTVLFNLWHFLVLAVAFFEKKKKSSSFIYLSHRSQSGLGWKGTSKV